MRAYRYMPRQFAEAAVRYGRLRLATFHSVASLESGLADDLDGAFRREDSFNLDGRVEDEEKARLARMGFEIQCDLGGPVVIEKLRATRRFRGYMLCCTDVPNNAYLREQSPGNDTVVEIADLHELMRRLTVSVPALLEIARQPVEANQTRVSGRSVTYGVVEGDSRAEGEAHPFKKALRFEQERELRIVWLSVHAPAKPLDVEVPEIRDLLGVLSG